jgi:1-acyl-sn-glycerol-3-phosphate acyltransferase
MSGADETKSPTSLPESHADDRWRAERFRPTLWSVLQARRIKLWLTLVGKGLLRLNIEVEGLELVPRGEPLIVAAAPHRNWIDPFLILQVLPPHILPGRS